MATNDISVTSCSAFFDTKKPTILTKEKNVQIKKMNRATRLQGILDLAILFILTPKLKDDFFHINLKYPKFSKLRKKTENML